jgi:hypothetical protein
MLLNKIVVTRDRRSTRRSIESHIGERATVLEQLYCGVAQPTNWLTTGRAR